MRYSDLHTHTTFSDGIHTVEEMVQEAIKKNMVSIGFSDHSFTTFDLRYCMKGSRLGEYLAEIHRVRDKYRGQIEVYAGLEYDGYAELSNRQDFDYLIGDCHYIKTWDGYHSVDHAQDEQWSAIETYFERDPMAYARAYYETYIERTRVHKPDILGHFDVVSKFGFVDEKQAAYRNLATESLIACLEVTQILEINTGPVTRKWRDGPFPNTFLLKEALAHDGKIIFSSDSHRAETLTGWFDDARELAKSIGFKSMMLLHNGKFEETGI